MADVQIVPKIRCDNCGVVEEKTPGPINHAGPKDYRKSKTWGSLSIDGGKELDAYGLRQKLVFVDLCPTCSDLAIQAVHTTLKPRRGE